MIDVLPCLVLFCTENQTQGFVPANQKLGQLSYIASSFKQRFKKKMELTGAGKMIQSVKYLIHKQEDLRDPSTHIRSQSWLPVPVIPALGSRARQILGAGWSTGLVQANHACILMNTSTYNIHTRNK